MSIHIIVSPHDPKHLIKHIIKSYECDAYFIDEEDNSKIVNNTGYGVGVSISSMKCVVKYLFAKNSRFKGGLVHVPFKSKDEHMDYSYSDQSSSSYNRDLYSINELLKSYKNHKNTHIVISVTDAYDIPSYIAERVTHVYTNNQRTIRSLNVLYGHWFHPLYDNIKALKKMLDENCKNDMSYVTLCVKTMTSMVEEHTING